MSSETQEVSIPFQRFVQLINAEAILEALKAAGVEGWEHYKSAVCELGIIASEDEG